jgi:hypothetical protein
MIAQCVSACRKCNPNNLLTIAEKRSKLIADEFKLILKKFHEANADKEHIAAIAWNDIKVCLLEDTHGFDPRAKKKESKTRTLFSNIIN